MRQLDKLAQHQGDILLAELAAILHDIGKFCDLHLESSSSSGSNNGLTIMRTKPSLMIRLAS